jgi:hypothetical protein
MPRHRPTFAGNSSDPSDQGPATPTSAHSARRGASLPAPDDTGTLVVDTARAALDTLPDAWRRSLGDLRSAHGTPGHTRHADQEHTRFHSARASSLTLAERHDPRLRQLATTALDTNSRCASTPHRPTA